ncbi:MAG: RtcB family protein [Polyangiaceae bacterium]
MTQLPNKTRAWLAEPLGADVRASIERIARVDDVARIALMPDVHLAENVCIGAVVASRAGLYPDAVGGDIGCGMAAVRLGLHAGVVNRHSARRLLEGFARAVPSNRFGQKRALPPEMRDAQLSTPALCKALERTGRVQLGTLGSGNHFLELQAEEDGTLWLVVHTGSRGLGPEIRRHHLSAGEAVGAGLRRLPADSQSGVDYLNDHDVAVRFASLSRRRILEAAVAVLNDVFQTDAEWDTEVTCTHNWVRRETHGGEELWVHRKGAMSAGEGEPGIIPGSMGTESFLVTGRGHAPALCSCSHGAGRAMSRGVARRRITVAKLEREMDGVWYDQALGKRLVDEAPSAYKPIAAVMRAQRDLTRITHRLRPVLSYKGV